MPTDHLVTLETWDDGATIGLTCKCEWSRALWDEDRLPSVAARIATEHVAESSPMEGAGNAWEGARHEPHGTQVQVGWLGQTGAFYAWWEQPLGAMGDGRERGSISPVYADRGE